MSRGGKHNWRDPNTVLVMQDVVDSSEAKVFRAHHRMVRARFKLPAVQVGGDNLVVTILEGLQERLKITTEFWRFIENNHEAVKIGGLEKNLEAIKAARSTFNKEMFPDATIPEGLRELTLRAGEAGSRWWPPLVLEDWHAVCQALCKGVEGAEWETFAPLGC